MEKKTIGGFIAALRKANGMTQKELAQRLNVSDKTVSRWECDDGAPDLSLIPAIAEIFGVTCDELLRAERRSPAERGEPENEVSPRGKGAPASAPVSLASYRNLSYIAMGVSVAGLIAASLCDLVFLKARLGFLIGAFFFAASIVCQAVFINNAFARVEDAGLDNASLSGYKRKVICLAWKSIGLTVCLLGFTFPLILIDAYLGLHAVSFLILGAVFAAAFALIYGIVLFFFNAALLKKGVYAFSPEEAAIYRHNHKLKGRCFLVLAVLLALTFIAHQFAASIWGPFSIMEGTTFDDYDSFIAYMEQDIPADSGKRTYYADGTAPAPAPEAELGERTYYDDQGNETSEKEALTRTLVDKNGKAVCKYIGRNETAVSIRYTPKEGTILPITVFTQADVQAAKQKAEVRHVIFAAAYCLECLAAAAVYFKKRKAA